MNKTAKILSILLSVAMVLAVASAMPVPSFAAEATAFSLNVIEETDTYVTVAVRLDEGIFDGLDLIVMPNSDKIGGCISAIESDSYLAVIKSIKRQGGLCSSAVSRDTCKFCAANSLPVEAEGLDIVEYTFSKNQPDNVLKDDFSFTIEYCYLNENQISAYAVNNLPAEEPSDPDAELSGACGDNATWSLDEATGTLIISGYGDMYDYVEDYVEYDTYCARTSAPWGFAGNIIKNVIIEDSITHIGDYAFYYFSGIENVTLNSSLESIGRMAFSGCAEISNVYYNAVNCQSADRPFNCSGVKNFYIADNVKTLPAYLLAGCEEISTVTIPESVESIGEYVLNAYALDSVVFNRYDKIDISGSMYDYPNKNTVVYCRENSFMHSYAEMYSLPFCLFNDSNDYFMIRNDVLEYYEGNSESVYVDAASKIGFGAFEDNSTVKTVELASNVTRIFGEAFKNCTNLEKVIIPAGVTSIGPDAFDGCENLTIWCYAGSKAEEYALSHNIPIEYIIFAISENSITLAENESAVLHASFNTGLADSESLRWFSDNPSVVSVSADGTVTALDLGEAEIIAVSSSGYTAYCNVNVGLKIADGADASIDDNSGIITGLSLINKNAADVENLLANRNVTVSSDGNKVGTGDTITVYKANGDVYKQLSVVIFGDVNGDGVYDGMDAMKVNLLANGMLTKEDVGEAAYMAADCNHDGVIDQFDVDILNDAGLLLAGIDQSMSEEELLETTAYVEYLNLIDQTVEEEKAEVVEEEPVSPVTNPLSKIISVIKDLIAIIKAAVAFIRADMPGLPFSFKK